MLSPEFIETHLDSFFQQQIARQKSGLLVVKPKPDDILTAGYKDAPEGMVSKQIITDQLRLAFERGLVLENHLFLSSSFPFDTLNIHFDTL